MDSKIAYKRRAILERELEDQYKGKIVHLPNDHCGMVDVVGVEWVGGIFYEVYIHLNSRRHVFYHTDFIEQTKILRNF